jgi:hypothetical protein
MLRHCIGSFDSAELLSDSGFRPALTRQFVDRLTGLITAVSFA